MNETEIVTTVNPVVAGISKQGQKRKVAIVLNDYPRVELSNEQRGHIQVSIIEAICRLPEGVLCPNSKMRL